MEYPENLNKELQALQMVLMQCKNLQETGSVVAEFVRSHGGTGAPEVVIQEVMELGVLTLMHLGASEVTAISELNKFVAEQLNNNIN